ncbi:energy transducer TonB [Kaistella daneshvariae]|jgi:hypothetical protein|nr:energy transducer TonB [Kaistella daneshvariae]
MKKLYILFLSTPILFFSQQSEIDTVLLSKMIVANVNTDFPVGKKLNADCTLGDTKTFRSTHSEAPKLAQVTDYILCNNGTPNMFFEIYDGNDFLYVKDNNVLFTKDTDVDNIKVTLSRRTPQEKSFVRSNVRGLVKYAEEYFLEQKEEELSAEKREALEPFFETEKYGLGFVKYNATSGYSSTGASFKIFNPSKKTIKYIWFTVAGENPVEDLVKLSNGNYYTTLKGIGPIESYGFGSWEFEHVWFTDIIEYLRISNIKIQYMDGSVRTVKYNENMYIGEKALERVNEVSDREEKLEKEKTFVQKHSSVTVIDQNKIYEDVDQLPEFSGGINKFRSLVGTNFDTSMMKGNEGQVKTEVSFIIEKDGSISDVKANGTNQDFNAEAVRTVKTIKNKWAPAKINGQVVRYRFSVPLTMQFD